MNITIKDVPKPVYQRLKKAAAQSGRSMNKFVIHVLEKNTLPVRADRAELLESVRKMRRSMRVTLDQDFLYNAIHEGRE
ncbi:MAG: hypothetical protein LBK71_12500 [Verrucomicrobiales bacterium]|jgi:uncharacterized protein (DUF885 family)|nr:hypothetical protein [Verrucomicrobiales bacterium]